MFYSTRGVQPAHVCVAKAKKQSTAWFFTWSHRAKTVLISLLLSTGPVLEQHEAPRALCVQAVTAPVAGREGMFVLCLSSLSHCWVHPFSVLMAPSFVDNFIRCFTRDKNQHNKTWKYLVLIFVCGYSVNILMQNVFWPVLKNYKTMWNSCLIN